MKKMFFIFTIIIGLISCNNNNSNETAFNSTGKILDKDLTLCVCWCGGYVIEIDSKEQTYRFSNEFPENISVENLPIAIKLNWELIECNQIEIT